MNINFLKLAKSTNKYRAKKTKYRDRTYDSKIEARRAAELDSLVLLGKVVFWIPQPAFALIEGFVYRPDFLVALWRDESSSNMTIHVEDVKAVETQRFRDCKRLWTVHGKIPLHILKKEGSTWKTETIKPKGYRNCY